MLAEGGRKGESAGLGGGGGIGGQASSTVFKMPSVHVYEEVAAMKRELT